MPNYPPLPLDMLMRPIKYVEENRVYTIIVADGTYATASSDVEKNGTVTLIDTHTEPETPGLANVTATLLESSWNAGEDFATLNASSGVPDGLERVYGIVCPKPTEAEADTAFRNNWFNRYVEPFSAHHEIPTAPFLWLLQTMEFNEPRVIKFKIRYEPHIIGPGPDGPPEVGPPPESSVPMVQMYPMTNPTGEPIAQLGWGVLAYRIDKDGVKQMFQPPPEWYPDVIRPVFGHLGLEFGKDPPLIAADVPYET